MEMNKTEIATETSKNGKRMRNLFFLGRSMSKRDLHKTAGPHTTGSRRGSTNSTSRMTAAIKAAATSHKSVKRRGSTSNITVTAAVQAALDSDGSGSDVEAMPLTRRRRRRMRRKSLHQLTSLASFVRATNKERMNLLEIAMTPSEVCFTR